jgi:hypothetical protein
MHRALVASRGQATVGVVVTARVLVALQRVQLRTPCQALQANFRSLQEGHIVVLHLLSQAEAEA